MEKDQKLRRKTTHNILIVLTTIVCLVVIWVDNNSYSIVGYLGFLLCISLFIKNNERDESDS